MDEAIHTGKVIVQRLEEALGHLHKDMERVDIWAAALIAFTQPVPDLEPNNDNMLSPEGPGADAKTADFARRDGDD